jgi:hypothetical protein
MLFRVRLLYNTEMKKVLKKLIIQNLKLQEMII